MKSLRQASTSHNQVAIMYHIIKVLSFLLCRLRFKTVEKLAAVLAGIAYPLIKNQRFTARVNLSLIFPEKSYDQITTIIKKNFKQVILTFIEILRLPLLGKIDEPEFFKHINSQYLEEAKQEKSVIFIGCHSGNWESVNVVTPRIMKYMVIVKRQKNAGFNRFLTEMRKQSGAKIVFDDDLRSITKYLKEDYSLAIMYDHGFKSSSLYTNFCNMEVQVPKSAFTLAQKYKRKLFPVFFSREGSVNSIKYFKPIEVSDDKINDTAQKLSDIFEHELKDDPYHYLWSYKRFKRSLSKRILILSDTKPGHQNQSISLANIVKTEYDNSHSKIVELKVSRVQRFLFDFLVVSNLHKLLKYNTQILKLLFPRDYNSIVSYIDIVISTGSSISSANRIVSTCLNAKSVNIMRPNVNTKAYDRIIMPSHDIKNSKSKKTKIIPITGALKFADKQQIKADTESLINEFNLDRNKSYISILIGGPLTKDTYDQADIKKRLIELKEQIINSGQHIIVSTSRRTPKWLEKFIETEYQTAEVKIIANKQNYNFAINGILGISHKIISTADSISMITEAATYKNTFILDLFNSQQSSQKHNSFVKNAENNKHIYVLNDISNASEEKDLLPIDNISTIKNAVRGLF